MASTLLDLVIMTPSSAFGTSSTIPLGNAATIDGVTYLSFGSAGATNGQQVSYSILDTANSEIGTATYTTSGVNYLTNRTPTRSTNGSTYINASSAALILAAVRGEDLNSFIVAGQLLGTSTNDNASAGNVGEYTESVIPSSLAVTLTTGVTRNITSISITAGDWDINAVVVFNGGAATTVNNIFGSVTLTSSTLDLTAGHAFTDYKNGATIYANNTVTGPIPRVRQSVNTATTVYLVAHQTFGSSNATAFGTINARRVR